MRTSRSAAKEQILDVATRLMAVQGYHRTALEDVLRESGAAKGNLYHHFQSKEALGYAIVDRLLESFTREILDPVFGNGAAPPLSRIEAFFEAILAIQRQRNCVGGCPIGNLATELADLHEGFRQRLAGVFDLWRERLAAALGEARADGTLDRTVDPDHVAHFLVAGLEGAMLLTKVQKDIGVMEACVAELRRHLGLYRGGSIAAPREPVSR